MDKIKIGLSIKVLIYRILILLSTMLSVCALILMAIFILSIAVPYIDNPSSYKFIRAALTIEKPISKFMHDIIPTKIGGKDITGWIIVIASFFVSLAFFKLHDYFKDISTALIYSDSSNKDLLNGKLERLQKTEEVDRRELLYIFTETKKKLDIMGKNLAFLSIDVVGSTTMKDGEAKASIEHTFQEYKNFIMSKLTANGAVKSAWTPDGVMIAFARPDDAIRAAQEVICGLEAFNKHANTLKGAFNVRCGVNSGHVYADDSMPMEEMSDHAIDVAGHMQKYAYTNSVFTTKAVIDSVKNREGFVLSDKIVDGYEVYMWQKSS